jgi:glycosidase
MQNAKEISLLNTVRGLLKIRREEKSLHEGSLELLDDLPDNVLGFSRICKNKKLTVLLNFDDREKKISNKDGYIFSLSGINDGNLKAFDGAIFREI